MEIKKIIAFIIVSFSIISCNENNKKNVEFKIDNSKSEISEFNISNNKPKEYFLKPEKITGIFTDIIVNDSLLICGNLYAPKLVNIYSLNSGKLLNETAHRGTDSNQGLSASNFYIQNNFLWIYDITLGKLFKTDFSKVIKDSAFVPRKEMLLKGILKNMVSPQIINDSLILTTSYSTDDCRYFYSDGSKILKKVGKLPEVINDKKLTNIPNTKIPNKAYIFKAFSIKSPTENKVAVFYNKTDRVEFYVNDKLYKVLNSTNNFNPEVQSMRFNEGYAVQDSENTKYAYLSVAYDKSNIYALYAGDDGSKTSSNTILIFDWLGNFVNKISLDRKVCKITFEPTKRILYCYDDLMQTIFSTKL